MVASSFSALTATGCGGKGDKAEGAGGTGGPNLQLGDVDGAGTGEPNDTCAGTLIEAKYIPLDMYIMLDKSGSMLSPTESDPNQTKWQAVSAALSSFLSDPASAGLGVGLQLFPLIDPAAPVQCTTDEQCAGFGQCLTTACWPLEDGVLTLCLYDGHCSASQTCVEFGECANDKAYVCNRDLTNTCDMGRGACAAPSSVCTVTDDCRAVTYATPATSIAELPGAQPALLQAIQNAQPSGLTPTGPALRGALQQASAWAAAHPDHRVVAVLATDGVPTLYEKDNACVEITEDTYVPQIDSVIQLAAEGHAATPSIATFAIGVMGPGELDGPAILDALAAAGGTEQAFIVDTQGDVTAQFRGALDQIRGARLSCELAVPEAEPGKALDYHQVNVTFDHGAGPSTLFYVEQQSGCDASSGGWYYDKPPSQGVPERILVCPSTCEQFGQLAVASVQIQLGCATRKPVK